MSSLTGLGGCSYPYYYPILYDSVYGMSGLRRYECPFLTRFGIPNNKVAGWGMAEQGKPAREVGFRGNEIPRMGGMFLRAKEEISNLVSWQIGN